MRKIDLSSNDPHITIDCPICQNSEMCRVDNELRSVKCGCNVKYRMELLKDSSVDITYIFNSK